VIEQEHKMNEPEKRPATFHPDPNVTGMMPLDSLDQNAVEPVESPLPYKPEPLFNKKVMLGWALATAAVWFAVQAIVPIAIESARTAIVESVEEVSGQHPGSTVTIRRNGKVITITRDPVTGRSTTTITAPPVTEPRTVPAPDAPVVPAPEPAPAPRK
jgi:hypothetical protein